MLQKILFLLVYDSLKFGSLRHPPQNINTDMNMSLVVPKMLFVVF